MNRRDFLIASTVAAGYAGSAHAEAPVRSNGPDPYVAVQSIVDELLKDISR